MLKCTIIINKHTHYRHFNIVNLLKYSFILYNPEPLGAKPPSLTLDEKNRFAFRYAKEDVSLWCQIQAYPIPAYRFVYLGLKLTLKDYQNNSQNPLV